MAEAGLDRKLAAIFYADVAGYSRLTGADEEGTHKTLSAYLDAISTLIESRGGRVLHYAGDAILAEFASIVVAVSCAVDIQRDLAARNEDLADDRKVLFRVGVNLGDVIVDRDELYGEGVNVAARLESLAEPGGICVSRKVVDEVQDKLDLGFAFLGEKKVKNIEKPVNAYQVLLDPADAGRVLGATKGRPSFRWQWIAPLVVLALVMGVGGTVTWLDLGKPDVQPPSDTMMAYPLPERPSIAVLPLLNLSADPRQEYFADGITDDLITDLSKVAGLFVIASNSAFAYKGRAVNVQDVARELGVRYALKGSVRRSGDLLRINVQLIDGTTGGHVWAERYDGRLGDVFALQDQVSQKVVKALVQQFLPTEIEQLTRRETGDVAAHDAYLRGLALYRRGGPDDIAAAVRAFTRALELDPDYQHAATALAKAYVQASIGPQAYADALGTHWSEGLARAWALLSGNAGRTDPGRHVVRSWLALRKHQHDLALAEARRALVLQPNDAEAMAALAEAEIFAGRANEGKDKAVRAMRQDPGSPARALYLTGLAAFALDDPETTVQAIQKAIAAAPARQAEFSGVLAAALGQLHRSDEARAAFEIFAKGYLDRPSMSWRISPAQFQNPRFHTWRNIDLAWAVFTHPFRDPLVQERFARGLSAAGAPEGVAGYISLHRGNRLNGTEIENLLFGTRIAGGDFWLAESRWWQDRDPDGAVTHGGASVHVGPPDPPRGVGETRENLLCENWGLGERRSEICVTIYRILDNRSRLRWGDYVMVTDIGPFPFSAAE